MNNERFSQQTSWQKHRNKFTLSGLFLTSFIVQLFITEFEFQRSLGTAIAQLITSWILSYVAVQFANKFYNYSAVKWWIRIYAFMVGASIIALVLFPEELRTMVGN